MSKKGLPKLAALYKEENETPLALPEAAKNIESGKTDADEVIIVYPNQSKEEQVTWDYLIKRDPYWQQQLPLGNQRDKGSTRVDFYHPLKRYLLFVDGFYWHSKAETAAWDEIKRSLARQMGYQVFTWISYNFEQYKRDLPKFYARDFG